ncbi:hypothetical protein EYF80_009020 [Liparis tanakae]|uniref:Uncharacterized protein n=1 Tax=Liparis tanakae TaxID=230148 RepID=A0A4Z2ISG1_9TELE|nr:hypothetical protein EYF80_009020 [Liparis tanakae]
MVEAPELDPESDLESEDEDEEEDEDWSFFLDFFLDFLDLLLELLLSPTCNNSTYCYTVLKEEGGHKKRMTLYPVVRMGICIVSKTAWKHKLRELLHSVKWTGNAVNLNGKTSTAASTEFEAQIQIVFIVITLHLVLDGCLEVTDPLEGQLEMTREARSCCVPRRATQQDLASMLSEAAANGPICERLLGFKQHKKAHGSPLLFSLHWLVVAFDLGLLKLQLGLQLSDLGLLPADEGFLHHGLLLELQLALEGLHLKHKHKHMRSAPEESKGKGGLNPAENRRLSPRKRRTADLSHSSLVLLHQLVEVLLVFLHPGLQTTQLLLQLKDTMEIKESRLSDLLHLIVFALDVLGMSLTQTLHLHLQTELGLEDKHRRDGGQNCTAEMYIMCNVLVVVAALLALQVKFGVLQFRCESLGFLLQLLDVSLGLVVIGLHVADLHKHTHLPFGLLLHLQLVLRLLLQSLLAQQAVSPAGSLRRLMLSRGLPFLPFLPSFPLFLILIARPPPHLFPGVL